MATSPASPTMDDRVTSVLARQRLYDRAVGLAQFESGGESNKAQLGSIGRLENG
jgi:hypothetical protein